MPSSGPLFIFSGWPSSSFVSSRTFISLYIRSTFNYVYTATSLSITAPQSNFSHDPSSHTSIPYIYYVFIYFSTMVDAENLACCSLFWAPLRPQFGKYGLFNAGGSYWAPAWLMLTYRALATGGLLATLIWAIIFGHIELIIACSLWLPCLVLLCICSYLHMSGYSDPRLRLLASVTIPIYQCMFSLSLFAFPMFIGFPARTKMFIEEAIFISAAIALSCVDILAFGSRVRFRIQILWLPILVDIAVFAVALAIIVAVISFAGISTVLGITFALSVIFAVIYAVFWSLISATLAVLITRVTFCCFPFRYENGDCEKDMEDPVMGCLNCRQGV